MKRKNKIESTVNDLDTLEFLNVKIVGGGVIPLFHVISKAPNVSSAMGLTSPNTIENSDGVTKLTQRLTPQVRN